jgi:flagellar biosynthesis chaperone FliJ
MSPRTRLDSAVRLQEQHEERALEELALASRRASEAEAALAQARERARQDHRTVGRAAEWQLADMAHVRALGEVTRAQQEAQEAVVQVDSSRSQYASAYARAEALRRVADTRRQEILRARDRAEDRALEELDLVTRFRAA